MPAIIDLPQIQQALAGLDLFTALEQGFVAYSRGKVVVPPVGELIFEEPPGDAHIKYGYIEGDDFYVVKIASGFYENVKQGLPPNSGLMMLFSQKTGALAAILLDEGHLTNVRTAVAGAIAAKYLKPSQVTRIGIFGTGTQARMQLQALESVTDCRNVMVWGRSGPGLAAYKADMERDGYRVKTTTEAGEVAASCNLLVTATPSQSPLLEAGQIRPGTHITAMGSDTSEKHELAPGVLERADLVVADSLSQCLERGEIHQAIKAGKLAQKGIRELGAVIADRDLRRLSDDQISVADLTGVAVQDIQISKAVYAAWWKANHGT